MTNIKEVVGHYQILLGSYAQSQFQEKYNQLSTSLQDMSFIKLEVLSRKKQSLYESKSLEGKRGDVKYIDRNEKQYFWDFDGEFWADELGDYVFALGSEC
jgi:nitrous oxidase accessory protein NosD